MSITVTLGGEAERVVRVMMARTCENEVQALARALAVAKAVLDADERNEPVLIHRRGGDRYLAWR